MLIALQAVGIDLTLLTVFGGALGVGIGLGLQKLASNYIAGFTILLDRSIRLGDMITVDNRFGVVAKLTARYVVVRSLDGIEAVVPNETLVTTTVLNHSYTSRDIRVAVPVQVSYDSDVERALALMEEAARAQPRVLAGAQRAGGLRRPVRRKRHRPRARRLDQRSGKRPGQPEERAQPRDPARRSGPTTSGCRFPQRDVNIVGGLERSPRAGAARRERTQPVDLPSRSARTRAASRCFAKQSGFSGAAAVLRV